MSSTPQQPPNPVDLARQAAAAPIAKLKEETTALLAVKKAQLAAAEQKNQMAANKCRALAEEIRRLEQTDAAYNQLTTRIASAKIVDPRADETCVL